MTSVKHSTTSKNWDNFWSRSAAGKGPSWSKKRMVAVLEKYVRSGMNVLDAGCGSGFFSAWFVGRGCRTYSLDYSKEALEMARAATGGKAEGYILADLLDETFGKEYAGRFDAVFTDGLFEHFSEPDQERIMANFMAALKPGGLVVTFCPNRFSPWQIIRPLYMPGIKEISFTRAGMLRLHRRLDVIESGGENVLPVRFSPERLMRGVFGMLLFSIAKKR